MTLDVSDALPYGPLERIEVYFEHDGPRFFALRSLSLDVRLLAFCTDEDDDTVDFLYLVLSPQRFQQVRSGSIGLREAFEAAEPWSIWRVVEHYGGGLPYADAGAVRFQEISDEDLPTDSARLNLPTPTVPALDLSQLEAEATSSLRTIAALELDAESQNLTEFSLRSLGQIGTRFQDSLDALAKEEAGRRNSRGVASMRATDEVQMNVLELRAASFAVVLGTDKRGRLLEHADSVEATLARLVGLVELGHQPDALIAELREHYGSVARARVVGLLRAVQQANSGLGVVLSPQGKRATAARLRADEVDSAVARIDALEDVVNPVAVPRGVLYGANARTGTFDLYDAVRARRVSGKVAPEAREQVDGLRVGMHAWVEADLLEHLDFSASEEEGGATYTLVRIAQRTPVADDLGVGDTVDQQDGGDEGPRTV
ncbi:DUF6575 domain-containing protein [Xylanimonas sp. McL0601]|uniref:DUF6575 domain-containing protein n=1 Tax=Xylanimonas sp. McL0601 TaxID=3414739 RepID=UPI003CEDE239